MVFLLSNTRGSIHIKVSLISSKYLYLTQILQLFGTILLLSPFFLIFSKNKISKTPSYRVSVGTLLAGTAELRVLALALTLHFPSENEYVLTLISNSGAGGEMSSRNHIYLFCKRQ